MAIVTYKYYSETYLGEPIAETDFPRAEAKAERIINQITHGRSSNYDGLPSFQQDAVTEAICAQIEYYGLLGIDVSISGDLGSNGWTVGKVHVNGTNGAWAGRNVSASMVCPAAMAALEQTGLLNPQVATFDKPGALVGWGWLPC